HIVLVFPDIAVSTAEAYAGVVPRQSSQVSTTPLADLLKGSEPDNWKDTVVNDFESSVFAQHTILQKIRDQLYRAGAFYASMSGSGSTLYGLFQQKPDLTKLSQDYSTWQAVI
ncbi:MAG: 4-(cytidine 5'-diphospho)-2-C-methyl-D-erythritol kinase, partial [Bacteroidota bacterium]